MQVNYHDHPLGSPTQKNAGSGGMRQSSLAEPKVKRGEGGSLREKHKMPRRTSLSEVVLLTRSHESGSNSQMVQTQTKIPLVRIPVSALW